jgi:circadian clock protein KaiC
MTDQKKGAPALIPTGIEGLDNILGGGLVADRIYLIDGDPGAGKTTLGLQFLLDGLRKGERGLYVTLSETLDELSEVARSHGWDLSGLDILELAPSEEALAADSENTMYHAWEIELGQTTRALLERVEARKPTRVVLDSLSEMRLLAQSPLRYRRQILALKQFFAGRHCTVLLLDDRTSDASDLHLQSIAHGVLALDRLSPEYGVMQRRLQVLKLRGRAFRAGFHDYIIARGGIVVFPRLVSAEHIGQFPPSQLKSGLTQLDAVMAGGLDRGTSVLLMGPAGAGKSTFSAQYAFAAAERGDSVAFFVFEESRRLLLERTAGLGIDLQKHVDNGRVHIRHVDPGEMTIGQLVHLIREQVEDRGAQMVVIDSLNGYLNAMPEVRFLGLHLHELLSYLGTRGVTTLMVMAQHGLVAETMQVPVDTSYLADAVVLLRYFEAAGSVRQALAVVKKRGGAHERTIREYRFTPNGIVIGEPLSEFQGVLRGTPDYIGKMGPLLGSSSS